MGTDKLIDVDCNVIAHTVIMNSSNRRSLIRIGSTERKRSIHKEKL